MIIMQSDIVLLRLEFCEIIATSQSILYQFFTVLPIVIPRICAITVH